MMKMFEIFHNADVVLSMKVPKKKKKRCLMVGPHD